MPNWKKVVVSGSSPSLNRPSIDDYIVHNGDTNSYMGFNGTDSFVIFTNNSRQLSIGTNATTLEYAGSAKLATTTNGVQVTGRLDANQLSNIDDDTTAHTTTAITHEFLIADDGILELEATKINANKPINATSHITASGNIKSVNGKIDAVGTDAGASIRLIDDSGNAIVNLARVGSGGNAHIGRMTMKDNATTKVQIAATGDCYLNGSSVQLGIGNSSPGKTLDVTGDIRASGTGSFPVLEGDTNFPASLEVDGPITGSAFQGTKHILTSRAFYVNDNPFIQNSLYFGSSLGNTPGNWNDPQATGGTISSVSSFTIAEDDMNWGYILPFDISKVEIQCSLRPGGSCTGETFKAVLYTAARSNNSNTAITLTKVAIGETTFASANYVSNDFDYTADLDKGSMIFFGVGTEDASPVAKNARGFLNITITQR